MQFIEFPAPLKMSKAQVSRHFFEIFQQLKHITKELNYNKDIKLCDKRRKLFIGGRERGEIKRHRVIDASETANCHKSQNNKL